MTPPEVFVEEKQVTLGEEPPLFTLETLDGDFVSLEEYGGHPMIINFWASWCEPCVIEMPEFQRVADGNAELIVIGVNLQEPKSDAKRFAVENRITYPLVLDTTGDAKRVYDVFTQPITFFIDSEFVVVSRKNGLLTDAELEEGLQGIQ